MQRNILIAAVVILTAGLGWTLSQRAVAQDHADQKIVIEPQSDKGALVINLTTGPEDLHKATMALQLAGHGLADGRKVVVFLNVRGPALATKAASKDWAFKSNQPLGEMVQKLITDGATVLVCPNCMEALGIEKDGLIDGAKVASRESLFGSLNAGAVVFSY